MKYRKLPVEIEAIQFHLGTTTKREILDFCPRANVVAVVTDYERDPYGMNSTDIRWIVLPTLEGEMHVTHMDFIIKGVKGEFYPCKPDIFAATYEPVDAR